MTTNKPVLRYDVEHDARHPHEMPGGDYVLHADYVKLESALESEREKFTDLFSLLGSINRYIESASGTASPESMLIAIFNTVNHACKKYGDV